MAFSVLERERITDVVEVLANAHSSGSGEACGMAACRYLRGMGQMAVQHASTALAHARDHAKDEKVRNAAREALDDCTTDTPSATESSPHLNIQSRPEISLAAKVDAKDIVHSAAAVPAAGLSVATTRTNVAAAFCEAAMDDRLAAALAKVPAPTKTTKHVAEAALDGRLAVALSKVSSSADPLSAEDGFAAAGHVSARKVNWEPRIAEQVLQQPSQPRKSGGSIFKTLSEAHRNIKAVVAATHATPLDFATDILASAALGGRLSRALSKVPPTTAAPGEAAGIVAKAALDGRLSSVLAKVDDMPDTLSFAMLGSLDCERATLQTRPKPSVSA